MILPGYEQRARPSTASPDSRVSRMMPRDGKNFLVRVDVR
jgi:hypothetical protein